MAIESISDGENGGDVLDKLNNNFFQSVKVTSGPYNVPAEIDLVFADGTFTINLPDPTLAVRAVKVKGFSAGSITVDATNGTVEGSTDPVVGAVGKIYAVETGTTNWLEV